MLLLLFLVFARHTTTLCATLDVPEADEANTIPTERPFSPPEPKSDHQESPEMLKYSDENVNAFLQEILDDPSTFTPTQVTEQAENSTSIDSSCYGCDDTLNVPYQSVFYFPYTSPVYYWFPQQGPEHAGLARRAVLGHGNIVAGGHSSPYFRRLGMAGHGSVMAVHKPYQALQLYNIRSKGLRSGFLGHAGGVGYIGKSRTRNSVTPEEVLADDTMRTVADNQELKRILYFPGPRPVPYHLGSGLPAHNTLINSHTGLLHHDNFISHQRPLSSYHHPLFRSEDNDGTIGELGSVELLEDENSYPRTQQMFPLVGYPSVSCEPLEARSSHFSEYPQLMPNQATNYLYDDLGSELEEEVLAARDHGFGHYPAVGSSSYSGLYGLQSPLGFDTSHPATGGLQTSLADGFPATSLHPHFYSSPHQVYHHPAPLHLHSGLLSPSSISSDGLVTHSPHDYGHPNVGSPHSNLLHPVFTPGTFASPVGGTPAVSWGHLGSPVTFSLAQPHSFRETAGDQLVGEVGASAAMQPTEQVVFPVSVGVDAPLDVPQASIGPDGNTSCNGSSSGYSYRKYSHSNVNYGYGDLPLQSAHTHLLMMNNNGLPPPQQLSPPVSLPYHHVRAKQGYDIIKYSRKDTPDHSDN